MAHPFDTGYCDEPFRTLCEEYPEAAVYPPADFRIEWGPVFHRGRLDGSARVLVLGQDPATHEVVARRILVGEAGQRVQGFLAKLGIDRSYVMVNTFLYGAYGQGGASKHRDDPAIAAYRHRWLNAIFAAGRVEAVVALGQLADRAWQTWKATDAGRAVSPAYAPMIHPTQPESSSKGDRVKHAQAITRMLANWNGALEAIRPAITQPDTPRPLLPYDTEFKPGDLVEIPEIDMPAGIPPWMRGLTGWADRTGATPALKRVTITITIPKAFRP